MEQVGCRRRPLRCFRIPCVLRPKPYLFYSLLLVDVPPLMTLSPDDSTILLLYVDLFVSKLPPPLFFFAPSLCGAHSCSVQTATFHSTGARAVSPTSTVQTLNSGQVEAAQLQPSYNVTVVCIKREHLGYPPGQLSNDSDMTVHEQS